MDSKIKILLLLLIAQTTLLSQNYFSGEMQLDVQFYDRDSLRGAANTPHFDDLKSGGDTWVSLNYFNSDIELSAGLRVDMFYNSNLHAPGIPFSSIGIGAFYVQKQVDKLNIFAGNIYTQLGNGYTFRTFEERPLGIDNSLLGIHLEYSINNNWSIVALGGKQKELRLLDNESAFRFGLFNPVVMGGEIKGYIPISDNFTISPGATIVNRTYDNQTMDEIVQRINSQPLETRFTPKFNVYAWSLYSSIDYSDWSLYIEYARKTEDPILDPQQDLIINADGSVLYTSLTYSRKGFGITGQYRRLDKFPLRTNLTDPLLPNNGVLNYLPVLTRQNSYRLPARYNAPIQDLGETTYELDVFIKPADEYRINLNHSDVNELDGDQLFREIYGDIEVQTSKKWKILLGAQFVQYNQEVYENKPDAVLVETVTPFSEFTYKLDRRKSIRIEAQYMEMLPEKGDLGSWVWGLVEFNIAPSWSFSVSDMWNVRPVGKGGGEEPKKLHYPTFFTSYTKGANRFSITYTKQVEGIVCTGGVCRFEPAFSGVKLGITSSF